MSFSGFLGSFESPFLSLSIGSDIRLASGPTAGKTYTAPGQLSSEQFNDIQEAAQLKTKLDQLGIQTIGTTQTNTNVVSSTLNNGSTSLLAEATGVGARLRVLEEATRYATFSAEYENYALTKPGWFSSETPITPQFQLINFLQSPPVAGVPSAFRSLTTLGDYTQFPVFSRGTGDRTVGKNNLSRSAVNAFVLDNTLGNAVRINATGIYNVTINATAQLKNMLELDSEMNFAVAHLILLSGIPEGAPLESPVDSFITANSPARVARGSICYAPLRNSNPVATITTNFDIKLFADDVLSLPRFSLADASIIYNSVTGSSAPPMLTAIAPAFTVDGIPSYTDGSFTITHCTFNVKLVQGITQDLLEEEHDENSYESDDGTGGGNYSGHAGDDSTYNGDETTYYGDEATYYEDEPAANDDSLNFNP